MHHTKRVPNIYMNSKGRKVQDSLYVSTIWLEPLLLVNMDCESGLSTVIVVCRYIYNFMHSAAQLVFAPQMFVSSGAQKM